MNAQAAAQPVAPVPSLTEWQARQAEIAARQDRIEASILEQIAMNQQRRTAQQEQAFDRLERLAAEMSGDPEPEEPVVTAAEVALIVVAVIVAVVGIVNAFANWSRYVA